MLFDGIVKREDLVELTLERPEIYTEVDILFEKVTTAINEALLDAKLLTEPYNWIEVRGGGCVSDLYLKQIKGMDIKPKDIDMFVQAPIDALNGFDLNPVLEKLGIEFEVKNHQRETIYEFMDVPFVIQFELDGTPVEFIMCRDIKRVFDFDITMRQFYYYKGRFYATKIGKEDADRRIIRVSCPITPISTLYRVFYMNSKYQFSIDQLSFRLLEWMFGEKHCGQEDVYRFLNQKREQYRYSCNYRHQQAAIDAVMIYLNTSFSPVVSKPITSSMLNGLEPQTLHNTITVPVKRDTLSTNQVLQLCLPHANHAMTNYGYHIPMSPFYQHDGSIQVNLEFKEATFPLPVGWESVYQRLGYISSHDMNYGIRYPFGFCYKATELFEYMYGATATPKDYIDIHERQDYLIEQFSVEYIDNYKLKDEYKDQEADVA